MDHARYRTLLRNRALENREITPFGEFFQKRVKRVRIPRDRLPPHILLNMTSKPKGRDAQSVPVPKKAKVVAEGKESVPDVILSPEIKPAKVLKTKTKTKSSKKRAVVEIQPVPPPESEEFDPIPQPREGIIVRESELAHHQPLYFFKQLNINEVKEDEEIIAPGEFSASVQYPSLAMPVLLNGQISFVPQNPRLIRYLPVEDGFDSPPVGYFALPDDFEGQSKVFLCLTDSIAKEDSDAAVSAQFIHTLLASESDKDVSRSKLWAFILRREIPREAKKFQMRFTNAIAAHKKTASSCAKEVKKKAIKNIRSVKEAPLRARRLVREMQGFWKKSEKDVKCLCKHDSLSSLMNGKELKRSNTLRIVNEKKKSGNSGDSRRSWSFCLLKRSCSVISLARKWEWKSLV